MWYRVIFYSGGVHVDRWGSRASLCSPGRRVAVGVSVNCYIVYILLCYPDGLFVLCWSEVIHCYTGGAHIDRRVGVSSRTSRWILAGIYHCRSLLSHIVQLYGLFSMLSVVVLWWFFVCSCTLECCTILFSIILVFGWLLTAVMDLCIVHVTSDLDMVRL